MTIKKRLEKLETGKCYKPYEIKSGYLKRLCSEQGIEPYIYPRAPEDILRDIQNAISYQIDKTSS